MSDHIAGERIMPGEIVYAGDDGKVYSGREQLLHELVSLKLYDNAATARAANEQKTVQQILAMHQPLVKHMRETGRQYVMAGAFQRTPADLGPIKYGSLAAAVVGISAAILGEQCDSPAIISVAKE